VGEPGEAGGGSGSTGGRPDLDAAIAGGRGERLAPGRKGQVVDGRAHSNSDYTVHGFGAGVHEYVLAVFRGLQTRSSAKAQGGVR
jgi:hypothetical protein